VDLANTHFLPQAESFRGRTKGFWIKRLRFGRRQRSTQHQRIDAFVYLGAVPQRSLTDKLQD
jgi:hypothetical protein